MKMNVLDLIRLNQHEKALSLLRNYLIDSPLLNEVIMIDSRLKNYTHRYIHQLLKTEQLEIEKNQITSAILSVLDKIPNGRNGKNEVVLSVFNNTIFSNNNFINSHELRVKKVILPIETL